jgi:transcriptional regulator with XRE-family HTH domain
VPIRADEVPFLEALGARVRFLRELADVSRRDLAGLAQMSAGHLGMLEWGTRRTRRSTLERIAFALSVANPDALVVDPFDLVEDFVALAGPALASESQFKERVDRRRERRTRKVEKRDEETVSEALPMARALTANAVAEFKRSGRWPEWLER